MNPTLERILTSRDPILTQVRENLLANRLHDENSADTFERLTRTDSIDRLLVPAFDRSAVSVNTADFDVEMPE